MLIRLLKQKNKVSKINYNNINIIIHDLIKVADSMIHDNPCSNKDKCEVIQKTRNKLYELRDTVLDILNKEEE